jgi:hypothetical protein
MAAFREHATGCRENFHKTVRKLAAA